MIKNDNFRMKRLPMLFYLFFSMICSILMYILSDREQGN